MVSHASRLPIGQVVVALRNGGPPEPMFVASKLAAIAVERQCRVRLLSGSLDRSQSSSKQL